MEYETRTVSYTVLPKGEKLFSNMATKINIEDDASGEYIVVDQSGEYAKFGVINITKEDWPFIRSAIEKLINKCRD